MPFNQELLTTSLRREAAKTLSRASYEIEYKDAGIEQVRELISRALEALEMSLPVANAQLVSIRREG